MAIAALYYYLTIVRAMFWAEPTDSSPLEIDAPTRVLLWVLLAVTLLVGVFVQPLLSLADKAFF